jgi:hypothetical protein
MDWIDLAQDRDKWRSKFLSSCTIGGFSRRAELHESVILTISVLRTYIEANVLWHIRLAFIRLEQIRLN